MTKEGFVPVDEWVEDEVVIYPSGRIMVVPFGKYIEGVQDGQFIIYKNTCHTRLVDYYSKEELRKPLEEQVPDKGICHYINYFLKFYDTDHELIYAYFKLNYIINKKSKKVDMRTFIHLIHQTIFTKSMIKKLDQMVEDNYRVDVETSEETYEQAFTNEHTKSLLRISVAMRLMMGPMFHYLFSNSLTKEPLVIYNFYLPLFDTLSNDSDIYNKIWITIAKKVGKTTRSKMWDLYEALEEEPQARVELILKQVIITDNMFKYSFTKNPVHFNAVIIANQLRNFFKDEFEYKPQEVSTIRDDNGLSGVDILEMNSNKIDESLIVLSHLNIDQAIERYAKDVTEDEIEYYKNNLRIDKFQKEIINYYYSKFMGYNDLEFLDRTQRYTLMIALKKHLQKMDFIYLPLLISSNFENKSERMINNQKFTQKVINSDIYQNMMKNKFSVISEDENRQKVIIKIISTFLNSTFHLVDYDNQDLLGTKLEPYQDMVSAEAIRYISMI